MNQKDAPFSSIPTEQRDALSKRLGGYVEAYRGRKWEKLYDFVSDTGKGGASQNIFVAAMKAARGNSFAQMPDLQELGLNGFRGRETNKREA